MAGDLAPQATHHGGGIAHVLDSGVGARADEHLVDAHIADGHIGLQRHVLQSAFDGAALVGVFFALGIGHAVVDGQHHLRRGAPGDLWPNGSRVKLDHAVEGGIRVGMQGLPIRQGLIPLGALRRERAALHVVQGGLIEGNEARARAGLDGHVAYRHAPFHAERTNGRTGELDGVSGAAGGSDLADDGQHQILAAAARVQHAINADEQVLGFLGQQGLSGQHMLDFTGADAMGQSGKCTVRGGVGIAAHHRHAGQGGTLFRADHVDDALTAIAHLELRDPGAIAIGVKRVDLQLRHRVGYALRAVGGRNVVVTDGQIGRQAPHLASGQIQTLEGLRTGHLVQQMTVDVQDGGAVVFGMNDVFIPKLVVERAPHGKCPLIRQSYMKETRHAAGSRGERPLRSALVDREHVACRRPVEELTWTADLVLGVADHFVELCNPAHGARKRKDRGEQRHRNADRALNDA